MSTQRGNAQRTRPQAHQNTKAFKNDLHDSSSQTKLINNIDLSGVCERCKSILEWKIKYKKYKPLKAPKKCVKCEQKTVKKAYHTVCFPCAKLLNVCPKCGKNEKVIEKLISIEEQLKKDAELQKQIKLLSLRRRRTLLRYIDRLTKGTNSGFAVGEDEMRKLQEEVTKKMESLKINKDDVLDDLLDDLTDESDED